MSQCVGLWTTEEVRNHHQSGGGGIVAAGAGEWCPLQVTLRPSEMLRKIDKNKTSMGS